MTDTTTLIERLEKATEGSRDLDAAIADIVGTRSYRMDGIDFSPQYTTSIDAALTLVPNRFHLDCLTTGDPDTLPSNPAHYSRCILRPDLNYDDGWQRSGASCDRATAPAFALCIAALRARQSETPDLQESE